MTAAWKAPHRPANEVSQTYSDGLVSIYDVTDGAQPGRQPAPRLREKVTLAYALRRLGVQRLYTAKQAMSEISHVIRVPRSGVPIRTQDVAILGGMTDQYRIDAVQETVDVYPPSVDLTLVRISQAMPREGEA